MNEATRLDDCAVWFDGPQTKELHDATMKELEGWDHTIISEGANTLALSAAQAISELRELNLSREMTEQIMQSVQGAVATYGDHATEITQSPLLIFTIITLKVTR
jgi:hypothetical protein